MTLPALHRFVFCGEEPAWLIGDWPLLLQRDSDEDWMVWGLTLEARDWTRRCGLSSVRLPRRRDMLAVVVSHLAARPLPVQASRGIVFNVRERGRYRSRCGVYEIRGADSGRRSGRAWSAYRTHPDSPDGLQLITVEPTLRLAVRYVQTNGV